MPLPQQLTSLVAEGLRSVDTHPNNELILPLRRKIWAQMGPYRDSQGVLRRYDLARQCAQKAMPAWVDAFPDDNSPLQLLEQCDAYVSSQSLDSRNLLNLKSDKFSMFLDLHMMDDEERAINAACSVYHTVRIILGDDVPQYALTNFEEMDEDLDLFRWDSSYYASAAFAGNFPVDYQGERNEDCDYNKLEEFWCWYLNEAVPSAYQAF